MEERLSWIVWDLEISAKTAYTGSDEMRYEVFGDVLIRMSVGKGRPMKR
jgi:hypothetical protein